MEHFYALLRRKGLLLLIGLALGTVILVTVRNNGKVNENLEWVLHTHRVLRCSQQFLSALKDMETGQRGYLLTGKEAYLAPFGAGKALAGQKLETLRELTRDNPGQQQRLEEVEATVGRKVKEMELTLALAGANDADSALAVVTAGEGQKLMDRLRASMETFITAEEELLKARNDQFAAAQSTTKFLQVTVLLLVAGSLSFLFRSLARQQTARKDLFRQIDGQNRRLILDVRPDAAGMDTQTEADEKAVVEGLITNLRNATEFIVQIGQGHYEGTIPGITAQNLAANQDNLSGSLLRMREQLRQVAEEDRRRNWTTEGLAHFADLLRLHGNNQEGLGDKIIRFLVKYLGANQGGLFLVAQEKDPVEIELVACYAYERKKYVHKTIQPGEGLVGQAVQEADTIYLTDVPANYVQITSGLGQAPPTALLIVPLKLNDAVLGVIELAFFQPLETYQVTLVEKLAGNMASAVASARMQERTHKLLALSQQQTEEMRAAEEEMRQNMEELEATQEEMRRKSETMESLLAEAGEREQLMQAQEEMMRESVAQLRQSQETIRRTSLELNGQAAAIDTALSTVEFNLDGTIRKANDNFLRLMGYELCQVQGIHHRLLVPEAHAASAEYNQFWENLREGQTQTGDFYRFTKAGKTVCLKASYTPVRDETGKVYKVIKFAHDVTRQKQFEAEAGRRMQRVEEMNAELAAQNSIINSVAIVSKTDLQGNITYANEAFLRWSQYSREEVMGKNHRISKSGEQPDALFGELWQTIAAGRIFRGEIKNRAKDGTCYWVDAIIAPVLGEDGKPKEYLAQAFVIDEAKEKEARLTEAFAQMQAQEQAMREVVEQLNAQKQ